VNTNRKNIDAHPLRKRIDMIEGSSIAPEVIAQVKKRAEGAKSVAVFLDSNHSTEHVAAELEAYAPLVTPGSYIVAGDGAQAFVSDIPRGKPEWKESNPLIAIHDFPKRHPRSSKSTTGSNGSAPANPPTAICAAFPRGCT